MMRACPAPFFEDAARVSSFMATRRMTKANPGKNLDAAKMPGHWLLARMGKRVLRPGGVALTQRMLDALAIGSDDDVVEFAPGLGITARETLKRGPKSYTAIERDRDAADIVKQAVHGPNCKCVVGSANATGLGSECASVVYGEAMLTMQPLEEKRRIVGEAARLLKPDGRYGIHEIALVPDDIAESIRSDLVRDISGAIHHTTLPLTESGWCELLRSQGLEIVGQVVVKMGLLNPRQLIRDEGLGRALGFVWNVARDRQARRRVLAMRQAFLKYQDHMRAIMLIGRKTP